VGNGAMELKVISQRFLPVFTKLVKLNMTAELRPLELKQRRHIMLGHVNPARSCLHDPLDQIRVIPFVQNVFISFVQGVLLEFFAVLVVFLVDLSSLV